MQAGTIAACAAVAAAVVSAINIEATRRLTRSMESTKWTRQLLPDLVRELDKAYSAQYLAYFGADWDEYSLDDAPDIGMDEFRRALDAQERLEVFASAATISAARTVSYELEGMRYHFLECHQRASQGETSEADWQSNETTKWEHYWRYSVASHAFVNAARKEMGLESNPAPPGLAARLRK